MFNYIEVKEIEDFQQLKNICCCEALEYIEEIEEQGLQNDFFEYIEEVFQNLQEEVNFSVINEFIENNAEEWLENFKGAEV